MVGSGRWICGTNLLRLDAGAYVVPPVVEPIDL